MRAGVTHRRLLVIHENRASRPLLRLVAPGRRRLRRPGVDLASPEAGTAALGERPPGRPGPGTEARLVPTSGPDRRAGPPGPGQEVARGFCFGGACVAAAGRRETRLAAPRPSTARPVVDRLQPGQARCCRLRRATRRDVVAPGHGAARSGRASHRSTSTRAPATLLQRHRRPLRRRAAMQAYAELLDWFASTWPDHPAC